MKNKTWIWICALVLVILAVLLIWKPFGRSAAPSEPSAEVPAAAGEAAPSQESSADPQSGDAAPTASENEEPEESFEPMILENGGDLEIVIPEDQATGGF